MKLYRSLFSTFLGIFFPLSMQAAIRQQQPMQHFFQQQGNTLEQLAGLQQRFPQQHQLQQQQVAQQPPSQPQPPVQVPASQPLSQLKHQQRTPLFHAPQPMLKGAITIDKDHGKIPEFRIYFHGKQTINNTEGFFSLPLDEEGTTDECFLLITKGLKQNFEKTNTVKNLVLFTNEDHTFYALKKSENQSFTWEEKKLATEEKNFALPPKTVIIILNPQLIERLESWQVSLPGNTFTLPRIVLKSNTKALIKDASARSLLGGTMNLGSFHEPVKNKVQHFAKGACSLAQ